MPKLQSLRLQFSLRFALAAMMLVSVALVVYRWPWTVVVDKSGESRTTTQYRRNWYGKSVKDGLELQQVHQGSAMERWYSDGDLRLERALSEGVAYLERHYQGGKMHGPCWYDVSGTRVEGQHHQGQLHGEWRWTSAEVITQEEWRMGVRHGPRTWKTPDGRLLQSAEYDGGILVRWNDGPISDELVRWLNAEIDNSDLRQRFLQPIQTPEDVFGDSAAYYGEVMYHPGRGRPLSVHWETRFSESEPGRVGRPIGEGILAEALHHSHTIVCRFNSFYAVPITAKSLDWQDRTGVSNVQFEPDSQQAQAWLQLEEADVTADYDRFQRMFRPTSKTGIAIDTSALKKPGLELTDSAMWGGEFSLPHSTRPKFPRRDLLGKHLDLERCYCEQQGNTLIIKRLKVPEQGTTKSAAGR